MGLLDLSHDHYVVGKTDMSDVLAKYRVILIPGPSQSRVLKHPPIQRWKNNISLSKSPQQQNRS